MKRIIFAIAAVGSLFFMASCGDKAKLDELNKKYSSLEEEYNVLKEEEKLVKGEYTETIETLNAIEDTLRQIADRESTLRELNKKLEVGDYSQREIVMEQINALIKANESARSSARSLQNKVNEFKVENAQLKKMIAQTETKLKAKEAELAKAQTIIEDMNGTLDRLESQLLEKSGELAGAYEKLKNEKQSLAESNVRLETTIKDLQNRDNFIAECARAYVACGDKKALRKAGIIKKVGDGLTKEYKGATMALKNAINFYDKDIISCDNGQIKEVLPERPADSYEINGNKIRITNTDKFWQTDKVVILVKD